MNEVLTLVQRLHGTEEVHRDVLAKVASIGMREFYQASASDFHPEAKFILADYFDYLGEKLVIYNGEWYRILRTYRDGMALELTVERAPVEDTEDGEVDG